MKCNTAKRMIVVEPDGVLSEHECRRLHRHLATCEACGAYRDKLLDAISLTEDDSATCAGEACVSWDFSDRLRAALAVRRTRSPAERLTRLLLRTLEDRTSAPARAFRCAAAAATALMVFFCAFWVTSSRPARPPTECSLRHIAALDTTADADGRIYAALTERRSTGYRNLREVYLK